MTQGIDERQRLEMALSFKVDPDDSSPLTPERQAELEARLAELSEGEDPFAADAERARGNEVPSPSDVLSTSLGTSEGFVEEGPHPFDDSPPVPTGQDIAAMVQAEIAKALGATAPQPQQQQQVTFEDVLKQIDPRDSEAALAMLAWLEANGRISPIATLNSGGGYLWHYAEPKGSTKAGYTPGATKGGRMVDGAVDQARAAGGKPRVTGMCGTCFSAVEQHEDGTISLDGDPSAVTHDDGTPHDLN